MLGLDSEIGDPLKTCGLALTFGVGFAFQTFEDCQDVLLAFGIHVRDVVNPVVVLLGSVLRASVKPQVVLGR